MVLEAKNCRFVRVWNDWKGLPYFFYSYARAHARMRMCEVYIHKPFQPFQPFQ